MPQVGTIHKLAGSKYLSLYQMDAVQRDGTHFDYAFYQVRHIHSEEE